MLSLLYLFQLSKNRKKISNDLKGSSMKAVICIQISYFNDVLVTILILLVIYFSAQFNLLFFLVLSSVTSL